MIFMCPKCGKEEEHVDTSKAYECGNCNYPVYKGIKLITTEAGTEEPEEVAKLSSEKKEYLEKIVGILMLADNILISKELVKPDRALVPYTKYVVEIIVND